MDKTGGLHTLIGKWIHLLDPANGSVLNQGRILKRKNGKYEIELYSFITGRVNGVKVVSEEELRKSPIYETDEHMRAAYLIRKCFE